MKQTPFDRVFSIMTKPGVMLTYLAFVAVCFVYIDKPLAIWFHQLALAKQWPVLDWLTNLGLGGVYLIGLPILALFFRFIYRNPTLEGRMWFVWLCLVVASLICIELKIIFGRSRPELLFQHGEFGFTWFKYKAPHWSFPSGHTTTIMALAFGLSIVFARLGYAFIGIALIIAFTRVILTRHYLSDVLATSYLVLIETGILKWVLEKRKLTK